MTKKIATLIYFLCFIPSIIFANVGVSMYRGGSAFGGIGFYSDANDVEMGISFQSNDASAKSELTMLFFQGDIKHNGIRLRDMAY